MNQHLERLDGCSPIIRQPVLELIHLCDTKLFRTLMIVYGWRSVQEQALLYQKGRSINRETNEWEVSDALLVVTNSKPGTTAHNVITIKGEAASMAVDLIPIKADGTADWEPGDKFWEDLYRLCWKVGLDPLGDPIGAYLKYDKGHFEEPAWMLKLEGLKCLLPTSTEALL
jgi:hypothetical protein